MTLGTALALMFSAANVFLRDVSNAVNVLSNFVRFGVPMMYPYTLVALRFHGHTSIYLLNPIVEAVLGVPALRSGSGATSHPARTAAVDMPPNLFWLSIRALLFSLVVLVDRADDVLAASSGGSRSVCCEPRRSEDDTGRSSSVTSPRRSRCATTGP